MPTLNGKTTKNPAEGSALATPKPAERSLGAEFGVSTVFPDAGWDTFAFSLPSSSSPGAGGVRAIANKASVVPLESRIEMRQRDGQTRSLLRLLSLPILACVKEGEWVASPHFPGGEKEVEFANNMFRLPPQAGGMTSPLTKIVRQVLLAAVDGFSAFEEVYHIPKTGPMKGKIALRKLAHRDSRTIRFLVDGHGGFAGVAQVYHDAEGTPKTVKIPDHKSWYYAFLEEENPFYGVSLFETAFRHYEVKSKLYFISQVAAQFAAVPGRKGTYPKNATAPQIAAFGKAMRDFAFDTAMMMPEGFAVDSFVGHTGFDFLKLIEHHSLMQSKSVLMQFADKDSRMVLIENNAKDASADLFVTSLQAIMDEIAESWSIHLMPKFIDWNFGSAHYPVFRFGPITDEVRDVLYDIFDKLVSTTQMNSVPEFFKEIEEKVAANLGLSLDYEAIRKEEALAAEAEAEAAAAAEAAGIPPEGAPGDPEAPGGPAGPEGGSGGGPAPAAGPEGGAPMAGQGEFEFELPLSAKTRFDELVEMAAALFTAPEPSGE